jgi:hypothetical protein
MTTTAESRTELSRALGHCVKALKYARWARGLAKKGRTLTAEAEQALTVAGDEVAAAIQGMQGQGIQPDALPDPEPLSIDQLDTSDTRLLLRLLEQAQEVAERVDASRGRVLPPYVPLQPGESQGTDLAEAISYLRLRVSLEVHGPAGRE